MTKEDHLIQTAQNLFMRFGFKRISVEEICQTAGVSKVTFYKKFKNKAELMTVILNRIAEFQMHRYHEIMAEKIPYARKVEAIIRMKQEQAALFSQELFDDLYKNAPPEIRGLLQELASKYLSTLKNDFVEAQKQGHIRQDIRVDFIIYFMNHMVQMAEDENLVQIYESPEAFIAEMMRFFFFGILTDRSGA